MRAPQRGPHPPPDPGTRERTISDDTELAARLAAGDERALAGLYDRYAATAYALALAILHDPAEAEEVVADAFAQLWSTAGSFDATRGSLAAWVNTVTRSRALDRLRTRRRRGAALDRAARESEEGLVVPMATLEPVDAAAERGELRAAVLGSLAELPDAQRRVIEMAYFGGLSQSEIAADLQEPLGTVKTRMRTGMERLRRALSTLRPGVER